MADTLANFRNWPLAQYEASYAERYERRWYSPSLLISTLVELWNTRDGAQTADASDLYDVDGEGMDITVRLLEAFRDDVTRAGKPFVLIYLPRAETITPGWRGSPIPGNRIGIVCAASPSSTPRRKWSATRRNTEWPR